MIFGFASRLRDTKTILDGIKRRYQPRFRAQLPRLGSPLVPLERVIIGLGSQKSGTTWLAWIMAQHPDIHIGTKEVHYWDTIRAPYSRWDSVDRILASQGKSLGSPFGNDPFDHSQYLPSLEIGRRTERIVGEITPAYALCSHSTFSEMKALHHDVRFIFLMRDPVDRLWSGLRHKMRVSLQRDSPSDWLERMFLEACDNPYDPDFRRSRYDETLTAMARAGCNSCVIFFESLFTEDSMQELAQFIGVHRLAGNFETRKNVGAGAELRLSDEARTYGRKALAQTYEFVADRYGDRLPAKWR